MQISVDGLVLRETRVGEYDKIITLLTKDYGKISVSAKGSKNLKSKLLAGTQTFSYGTFVLFYGKGKYSLNDVELIESFFDLRLDVASLALAGYVCEIAGEISEENTESGELLSLVLNTLHLASKKSKPLALIKSVFELRAMSISGFAPNLVACSVCAVFESERMCFSASEGILFCGDCFDKLERKPADAVLLSASVLYAMRFIIFSDDKKIFSFKMSDAELSALSEICESYVISKMERSFNTLEFYKTVKD